MSKDQLEHILDILALATAVVGVLYYGKKVLGD